ncbi:hypothetical protein BGZ83_011463 [Gryganskiella cystojenkinii]|nr:hypothetical protein BGZ83_011463 [Gryganskiella cystojenkinii]
MDTHGYNPGQSYSYANSQGYGYQSQRRTLGGNGMMPYMGNSFLPSLKRCVATLELSTQLLRSSVTILDEASSGYPRLKTITSHTKRFELVSEQDITLAQTEVSKDVEPRLHMLTEKTVEIVLELENKEHRLLELIEAEKEKEKTRLQRQKAARSGLSNIKKLQTLTRRKEDLSKRASELENVLEEKRKEFGELMNKSQESSSQKSSAIGSSHSAKRVKRNPETRDLNRTKEAKKAEVSRQSQELDAIQRKIEEKSRIVRELRSKAVSQLNGSQSGPNAFNPTVLWPMYSGHLSLLEHALEKPLEADLRDKDTLEVEFERTIVPYLQELEEQHNKTDRELDRLMTEKTRKLAQLRNLCKQLFPDDNIGLTINRLMELLVESPVNEVYYKDIIKHEFPVEEDRRHNLSRVLPILTNIGLLELVREIPAEEDTNQHGSANAGEQLILRIRFEDNNSS